jgi:thiamine pyrophosphate-dependent acetolactate synthase large subunit-like protein
MSGKRAFLKLLKQEGVDILFGNPGTTELPLMDVLAADRTGVSVAARRHSQIRGRG